MYQFVSFLDGQFEFYVETLMFTTEFQVLKIQSALC